MVLNDNAQLTADLLALHTKITEITHEQGSIIDSDGKEITDLPVFTRVSLESTPGEGSYIRHEVWLPEEWNGCFIGTGNGGMAGKVLYTQLSSRVKQGYAAANTDLGTSRGRAWGVHNPDVYRDFGWRATYLMTAAGKKITEAFYGKKIDHAYFVGGSTGGQQALMLAQRYPTEYDGISAGVPAHNRLGLHTYFLWGYNVLKKSGASFDAEELARITQHAIVFSKMTGRSEEGDLFVSNPGTDEEYIERFIDYLRQHDDGLSEVQLGALKQLYTGPVNPRTGKRIYCGLPIGSEVRGSDARSELLGWQKKECPRIYPFTWIFGEGYTGDDFDFDADMDRVHRILAEDMNANDPDLRPFFAHGGKLFMYSGSNDSIVPFPEAMKYYDRMTEAVGGIDTAMESARYFLVPGQDHKANIMRYGAAQMNGDIEVRDVIQVLRLWREKGIAPDSFAMATEINAVRVEKTIFPYGSKRNPSVVRPTCDEMYL